MNCFQLQQKQRNKFENYTQHTFQIINCILCTQLDKAKKDPKIIYEDLQLYYLNFLSELKNKPLLAFVELKKYENILNQQSNYFLGIKYYIGFKLQKQIRSQQNQNKQQYNYLQQTLDKQIDIFSVFETLKFQEEFIPKIQQIISEKINFWNQQIKGFYNIYEIQTLALSQSQKIQNLEQEICQFCKFNIQSLERLAQTSNILNIKFISIFYSVIMNDYYGTQICEQTINEIYNIEHAQQEDIINNITFIEEKSIILLLSMVKNRGQIINKDKKLLSKYFEIEEQEFNQINNINYLMPQFFAEIHDMLLNDFLITSKSIFFDDYKILFGQSTEGFLIPQQLKLENDFSHVDDYVLIGCMSKIKSSSDFVLFCDDGYLIGCTQNFYDTFFQFSQSTNSSTSFLHQINIYMLFPNILDLLTQFKNDGIQQFTDNYCKIQKFQNLKELLNQGLKIQQSIKQFSTNIYDRSQTIQKSRTSQTTIDKIKIISQFDNIENKQGKQKIINYLQSLPIYNVVIQNQILENMKSEENSQKQSYQCRADLCYKIIGRKEQRRTYFILEITDIRRIDETRTLESIINNNQFSKTIYTSMQMQKSSENNTQSQILNTEQGSIAIESVKPDMSKLNELSILLKKYGKRLPDLNKQDSQIMESARDSFAPISQRIEFISPSSKQQQFQGLIDKEFSELLGQLEYGSRDVINDQDIPDPSQIKGISSNEKEDKNINLLQQLQNNQQNKDIKDIEASVKKSRSSNTSGTSGISAIQVIKQFQQQKSFTQSLKIIFYINVLIIVIIIIYIIIHLINVKRYHDELQQSLIHITAPLYFNRDFFQGFCFLWSIVFSSLQIIGSSDFIIIQTIQSIKELAQTMISQIREMYGTFVSIENAGLLSNINIDFLYQEDETVSFTYFITFIQNLIDQLFQAQYYTKETLLQLINVQYLDNLITLRYNLKFVKQMNFELLDQLNIIFLDQLDIKLQEYQVQISIEIIILCLIIFLQIYYWNQLEKYCQQILLLVGRLQENQAQEQIIRFSYINETLITITGKQSWKQQNYYSLVYQPINLLGIESQQYTSSKILKEYKLKLLGDDKKFKIKHNEDNQKKIKKNQNVVLNSRINNSNISIFKEFIFITIIFFIFSLFIIGGYILYNQQSQDLHPTEKLALNFIRFTSQQDITLSIAFIIKSQLLLYDTLIKYQFYTKQQIDNILHHDGALFPIFLEYHDTYYENLTEIYEFIINSNSINDDDEALLLSLYQDNFCIELQNNLPFCNKNISNFNQLYGEPDIEDDNSEYLSQGIQGIVSRIDTFFKQYYQYEITNKKYNPDLQYVQEQMHTPDFFHIIFEHFLFTTDGTYLFIDTIIQILKDVLLNNLITIYYYYFITGISLLLLYILIYTILLSYTNNRLILLRLILTNLPIEILTDTHTLTLLKKLK